jgi:predicted acyl esterase
VVRRAATIGPVLAILLAAGSAMAPAPTVRAAGSTAVLTPSTTGCPAASGGYTLTAQKVTVHDGPGNLVAKQIDTDLYVPTGATAATPQPAVIYANGFGGSKDDSSGCAIGRWLAQHNYVVLAYSSSGFGHSGGCIELDAPQWDVQDVKQLVDYLATLPVVRSDASGPIVGMTGGSYGGAIQELSAEFDGRIRAITPFRTWNTLNYSLSPQHLGDGSTLYSSSAPAGVVKALWTTLFFASGNTQFLMSNGQCITADPVSHATCAGFEPSLCTDYFQSAAAGEVTPDTVQVLANSSPLTWLTPGAGPSGLTHIGLKVPTLLAQGESDTLFNLDEAAATYRFLRDHGVPTRMIWHAGGHGYDDQAGEGDIFGNDQSSPDAKYLPRQILAWFDRYLRGDTTVSTGPQFSYFQDWMPYSYAGDPSVVPYASAADFPFEPTATFALSGSSDLAAPGAAPVAGSATIVAPPLPPNGACAAVPQAPQQATCSFTEFPNFQQTGSTLPGGAPSPWPGTPPSDPPGTAVTFTSPPFSSDVVSVGIPTAHLHLGNANPANTGIVLYAKVYDVAADGSATLLRRLIAPFRAGTGSIDVFLDGIAHRFAAGHAVRLELAATDATSFNDPLADVITVTTGGADPSRFTLPVSSAAGVAPQSTTAASAASHAQAGTLPNTAAPGAASGVAAGLIGLALAGWGRRRRRAPPALPG